jgi:hypothetical protein
LAQHFCHPLDRFDIVKHLVEFAFNSHRANLGSVSVGNRPNRYSGPSIASNKPAVAAPVFATTSNDKSLCYPLDFDYARGKTG